MLLAEIIPSHRLAAAIINWIHRAMETCGLDRNEQVSQIIYVVIVIFASLLIGWLLRMALLAAARKIVELRNSRFTREMLKERTLYHCSHIVPPLVMMAFMPISFRHGSWLFNVCQTVLQIYLIITLAIAVCSVLTLIWTRYDDRENTRNLPLKGILNTGKGIVWIVAVIIAASVLMDKSPAVLLTGLGAFAAALMLIFKDSILGFVAGIQLAQNNMVHVGDWIVVPSTPANGIVLDMSLTTVKVQNFDNTIVTLPPYTLVSSSFQNWRGMKESGARRIMRSILIETTSVRALAPGEAASIAEKLPLLKKFIAAPAAYNPGADAVNGTTLTNLGLMRAYLCCYILDNAAFAHDQQILVRLMDPTPSGIPLQIYCFTATTAWTAYEAIQSALFEHIATIAPLFGINFFNTPSNDDVTTVTLTGGNARAAGQS